MADRSSDSPNIRRLAKLSPEQQLRYVYTDVLDLARRISVGYNDCHIPQEIVAEYDVAGPCRKCSAIGGSRCLHRTPAHASPFCDAPDMSAALYGLLGALGGSFFTAVAAYLGPIQVQRRANEQARLAMEAAASARTEELADAEAARVYAEQVELQRSRERQHARDAELARIAAGEAQRRYKEERHAAMERIIRIRITSREWCQTLSRYLEDLKAERIVRVEDFDKEMRQDRRAAQSAIDQAIRDGFAIQQTQRSPRVPRKEASLGLKASPSVVALNRATDALRAVILEQQLRSADRLAELDRVVTEAEEARSELTQVLWDFLERLGSGRSYD